MRPPRPRTGSSAAFASIALALAILPWIGCALGMLAFGGGVAQMVAHPPAPGTPPPMYAAWGLIGGMFSFLGFSLLAAPAAFVARLDGEAPGRVKLARALSIASFAGMALSCVALAVLVAIGAYATFPALSGPT